MVCAHSLVGLRIRFRKAPVGCRVGAPDLPRWLAGPDRRRTPTCHARHVNRAASQTKAPHCCGRLAVSRYVLLFVRSDCEPRRRRTRHAGRQLSRQRVVAGAREKYTLIAGLFALHAAAVVMPPASTIRVRDGPNEHPDSHGHNAFWVESSYGTLRRNGSRHD